MPTGVALRDVRQQLFDAAERVLGRDGPGALTSRAVTTEAGCAKGVLHRHFADFDDFLVELVRDRVARVTHRTEELRAAAGTGTVVDNVTDALMELYASVAVSIVALVIARDELRARLRAAGLGRLPILTHAGAMLATYLTAERDRGRLSPDADLETLAPMLIGTGHVLSAGTDRSLPARADVEKVVSTALAPVLQ